MAGILGGILPGTGVSLLMVGSSSVDNPDRLLTICSTEVVFFRLNAFH